MQRLFSLIRFSYVHLLIVLNYISVICIFLMAVWVFCDVIGRYLFNHPIPGTTELVKCAIIVIVFLGVAYAKYKKRHIRTVLIVERLPWVGRRYCEIIGCLLMSIIFALMCFYAFKAGMVSWHTREFEGVLVRVPIYPSRFTVVIGSGLLVIQSIVDLIQQVHSLITHTKDEYS